MSISLSLSIYIYIYIYTYSSNSPLMQGIWNGTLEGADPGRAARRTGVSPCLREGGSAPNGGRHSTTFF